MNKSVSQSKKSINVFNLIITQTREVNGNIVIHHKQCRRRGLGTGKHESVHCLERFQLRSRIPVRERVQPWGRTVRWGVSHGMQKRHWIHDVPAWTVTAGGWLLYRWLYITAFIWTQIMFCGTISCDHGDAARRWKVFLNKDTLAVDTMNTSWFVRLLFCCSLAIGLRR